MVAGVDENKDGMIDFNELIKVSNLYVLQAKVPEHSRMREI